MPPGMAAEFRDMSQMDVLALNRLVSELIAVDADDASGGNMVNMPWRYGPGGNGKAQ